MVVSLLRLIVFLQLFYFLTSAPQRITSRLQHNNQNYIRAISAQRRLKKNLPREDIEMITIIGILNGAVQCKNEMENHLTKIVTDLIFNSSTLLSDSAIRIEKIENVEKQIQRDQQAIEILSASLDLANKVLSIEKYREKMNQMLLENKKKKNVFKSNSSESEEQMNVLRKNIIYHIEKMRTIIYDQVDRTLKGLADTKTERTNDILRDFQANNLTETIKLRRNANATDSVEEFVIDVGKTENMTTKQEKEMNSGPMPGGLITLITSLSEGENGSDVGALIGALTGLVSMLFGPGGLDVESLISSATSLFAGLLAGNKNFGTVLGEYVGTAFDGLSGGGGAANNGKFIGNFMGTVFASLSANPEDDDEPPQPEVFVRNLLQSFIKSNKHRDSDIESMQETDAGGHLNSFSFIKQIVSSIVGGVANIFFSSSLALLAGTSQGLASSLQQPTSHSYSLKTKSKSWL